MHHAEAERQREQSSNTDAGEFAKAAESPETIRENFEVLRLEEVYGAIAYYLANQSSLDAYLLTQGEKWADGKRNAEPLPPGLQQRLARARDGIS